MPNLIPRAAVLAAMSMSCYYAAAASAEAQQPWLGPMTGVVDGNGAQTFTSTNPALTANGLVTAVPLSAAFIVSGGVAVTAIAAGNRTQGGWIQNPPGATAYLCVNEYGTAVTAGSGTTACLNPGQSYSVSPGTGAVSVVATDTPHPFAGLGFR